MQINNTFTHYQGYEFNPEISSSNGCQNTAYAPYVNNPQTTAHNSTPGNGAYGFTTVDTASSCRLDNHNGTQSYIAATRISSFHQSLDSIGWSSNNSEYNYRTEVSATVISNGYKHSSNPKSDKSIYQSNENPEYNMHNRLPSYGSGASKKFYSNSDKPVRSPTSFSVNSVPPKERGRVRNRSIEPSRGFDSGGRSAKYFELNIKREGIAPVISNGYLHSSNPESDKSTKEGKAITDYDRYKRSPSHGRETKVKVYSHSDKLSKTVKSPINRSQRSVSPKDHGRAKEQTIEWTSGFDSKKVGMATVIPNGHFHSQNPDSDKSTNKSITGTDYDSYKRLPSLGNETSKKLNSHSGKLRKSPISRSLRSVSPMVRGRKRSLSIESSKGLDSSGRSSKYIEHSNQREGSTTVISKGYLRSRNSSDKSTKRNNIRTENDRFIRSPSYGRETPKTYSHSDKLRKSPISRSRRSVSPKDRSRNAILKSPISRSRRPISPENRGRKRSQSIESSRSVLRSREENNLRETRRKSIDKRNSNLGRKSTSPKQRFKRTSHDGRKSNYPMSKNIRYRRSPDTNKQRGNAHSSTSRTRSNHSKPRR